jgi:hypothetical protein
MAPGVGARAKLRLLTRAVREVAVSGAGQGAEEPEDQARAAITISTIMPMRAKEPMAYEMVRNGWISLM